MTTLSAIRRVALELVAALLVSAPALSAQTLVTTRPTGLTTIDFTSLFSDNFYSIASFPGMTLEPISDASFYAIGSYGLGDNGQWVSSGSAASGVGTGYGFGSFLRFTFNTPVSFAGGFVNYCMIGGMTCNGFSATMRAFDSDFNVIGAYDVDVDAPIATTADNDGDFRGILVDTPAIKYLDWGGSYVTMSDVTFGTTTVTPEPASMALLGTGLVAIGGIVRRRRRHSA